MSTEDWCMLGLWDFVDNRLKLDIGVGWNVKAIIPPLSGHQAGGYGVAGPSGYCYRIGDWRSYGHQLANPVLGRYQKYDEESRQWVGRHRADG